MKVWNVQMFFKTACSPGLSRKSSLLSIMNACCKLLTKFSSWSLSSAGLRYDALTKLKSMQKNKIYIPLAVHTAMQHLQFLQGMGGNWFVSSHPCAIWLFNFSPPAVIVNQNGFRSAVALNMNLLVYSILKKHHEFMIFCFNNRYKSDKFSVKHLKMYDANIFL